MVKKMFILLIGSLCLSAVVGITIILMGNFGRVERNILSTTVLIFLFSIPGLCSATIYNKKNLRYFSIAGMIIAVFSWLYMTLLIWEKVDFDFFNLNQWKFLLTLIMICIFNGIVSLLLLINNNSTVRLIRNITIGFAIVTGILILLSLWEVVESNDTYVRFVSIMGIVLALGILITPILNKIYANGNKTSINAKDNSVN